MSEYFVHDTSVVDANVQIGKGTKIWHFSHILPNAIIGENCILGQNVMVDRDVVIGNGCKLQNNVSIYKDVTLEDDVFCGPSCVFTNVYNPRAFIERKDEFLPTIVKIGATIGANATIVCGITIGEYSFIGAGAVVTKDTRPFGLYVGSPAKRIGWTCRCGELLRIEQNGKEAECTRCASKYKLAGDELVAS